MFKNRLLNICLIVNLGLVFLWPQASLAFNLFGPSEAEKQILFLQGYNIGMAKALAVDELGVPIYSKTKPKSTAVLNNNTITATSTYVTNPLSANLDVGNFGIMSNTGNRKITLDSDVDLKQWTLSNGSVHLNSGTTGYNPLSVGAFGTRAVAFKAAATNTEAYAGKFEGNVDINKGMLTINDPYNYSTTTPPAATVGLGVSGSHFGVVGFGYDSYSYGEEPNNSGSGILGVGYNGVKGEARYGSGKAIWGVAYPEYYPGSYAGYFEGNVNVDGLFRTKQVCVQDNMTDLGACLGEQAILGRSANAGVVGDAMSGAEGTGVLGQGFYGVTGSTRGNGGAGIYGKVVGGIENAYAGYFDGQVAILNGKLAIGKESPEKQLDIYTDSGNAEIAIQSGNAGHWGIYQVNPSGGVVNGGALNFWHGENRLTINDKGITTNGICLGKVCVTKWEDLKAILNPPPTPPTKPGVTPVQQ